MLNLIRKFLRPTLREQLEDGVRDALKRYADRRIAPDLRVYVSMDLLPQGVDAELWARDEADHLRRFATQWAQDNGIGRAGLRLDVVLLDTKREFAFVKPVGLERAAESARAAAQPLVPSRSSSSAPSRAASRGSALLEVVSSPVLQEPLQDRWGSRGGSAKRGWGDGARRSLHVFAPRAASRRRGAGLGDGSGLEKSHLCR